jgi:tetratricopeptide (TPR) repeat protein
VHPASSPSPVSFEAAGDLWTDGRGSKAGLDKAIDALRLVVADEPDNQEALALLSQSLFMSADAWPDDEDGGLALFEEGVTTGERAMACDSQFGTRIDQGEKPGEAAFSLQTDDLPSLYWTAMNLDRWSQLEGGLTRAKYKGYIAQMMTHCLALDETAFHAGPRRFWGAWYSRNDVERSREFFEKARTMFPDCFATYVTYAETYAVRTDDRELFMKLLEHVLAQPVDVLPDVVPEQKIQQRKARALFDQADELFRDID